MKKENNPENSGINEFEEMYDDFYGGVGDDSCSGSCSTCQGTCSGAAQGFHMPSRTVRIDYFYLDQNVCERGKETAANLEAAIRELTPVLGMTGFQFFLNSVSITTREMARNYRFESSPTIRINGTDLEILLKDGSCVECKDPCIRDMCCRVWICEGKQYEILPKEMLVTAILNQVFGTVDARVQGDMKSGDETDRENETGGETRTERDEPEYRIPKKLERCFQRMDERK